MKIKAKRACSLVAVLALMLSLSMALPVSAADNMACLVIEKADMNKVEWLIAPKQGWKTGDFQSDARGTGTPINQVLEPDFDTTVPQAVYQSTVFHNGYAVVDFNPWDSTGVGLIDESGQWIIRKGIYDNLSDYGEGYVAAQRYEQWGFVDLAGNWVTDIVAPTYARTTVEGLNEGHALVRSVDDAGKEHFGLIDKSGAFTITMDTFAALRAPSEGLCAAKENDRWGYVDTNGKWVIRPKYLGTWGADYMPVSDFVQGVAIVSGDNKRPVLINTANEIIAPDIFKWGTAPVTGDSQEGAYWYNGGILVEVRGAGYGIMKLPAAAGVSPVSTEPPSSWAAPYVTRAIEQGFVPLKLQGSYTSNITRADFCSLLVPVIEACKEGTLPMIVTFDDIDPTRDVDIMRCASIGIVTGTGDNLFNPNGEITREQAATMLMRAAKYLGLSGKKPVAFSDSAAISTWAAEGVDFVSSHGIMTGMGDNRFEPQGKYTREQSMITIMRLFDLI